MINLAISCTITSLIILPAALVLGLVGVLYRQVSCVVQFLLKITTLDHDPCDDPIMVRQDATQNIVYKKNLKLEATRWEYVLIFLNFPLQATCIMVDAVLFQLSAFFALFGKFLLFFLSSQISSLYVSPPMVKQIDFLNNIKNPQNHNRKNQLKLCSSRHDNPLQQPRREKARSCEPMLSKDPLWCFAG